MSKPETPMGIPKAEFIEDLKAAAPNMEVAEKLFQDKEELLAKYRFLEQHLLEKQQSLKVSRPEVAENLNAVQKLATQADNGEFNTHFQIADSVYGTAKVGHESTVSLWLGANLMVEYSYDEAKELLQKNLDSLDNQISQNENTLSFLRDQIITSEVTISRLTNHMIQMRREKK